MKMKQNFLRFGIILFFLLTVFSFSYASVEVFSKYDTTMKITSSNTIEVNKSMALKNVYEVGIVPGQIEFKIGSGTEGSVGNIAITNIFAYDEFGNEIRATLRETSTFSTIILDVFYPLLPGFEYHFDLNYELMYEPGGIFFKSLNIPIRESTIPIEDGNFKIILPERYHFTFTDSDSPRYPEFKQNNIIVWDIKDDVPSSITFEYSYLPIKLGNFKGSYVFWITLNLLLFVFLIYEVRKELKRYREEENEV